MAGNTKIFRKISLQRLSSPEQLDQLAQVTNPRGWIALAALGGLLVTAILWGFFGSIPTKIYGHGILIKSGGVFDVVSVGGGQVTDVAVEVGDEVEEGQVVARIAQPRLQEQIQQARATLDALQAQYAEVVQFGHRDLALHDSSIAQQQANLAHSIRIGEERLKWLEERIATQEQLLEDGLIVRQTLLNSKQSYYDTQTEIERYRNQLKQLESQALAKSNQKDQELFNWQSQLNTARHQLEQLTEEYELYSKIVSPYTGRVLEIMFEPGSLINPGVPVLRLDLVGRNVKNLEAVLYVSSMDGKRIKPGMEVRIAPTTVKQEEFGFILGDVTYISDFPATTQGMMRVLKNQQLAATLAGGGAPFEVYADLRLAPDTPSGYQWSSSLGPALDIQTGTMCLASITVDVRRPIELVVPLLREYTGI